MPFKIGVLAIQGSFKEHLAAVSRLGAEVVGSEVRSPAELEGLDALILPGGESTAIGLGLVDAGLAGANASVMDTLVKLVALAAPGVPGTVLAVWKLVAFEVGPTPSLLPAAIVRLYSVAGLRPPSVRLYHSPE